MKRKPVRTRAGKYDFDGGWDRVCACRHTLGNHAAAYPHDCLIGDCACAKFVELPKRRKGEKNWVVS